MTVCIMYQHVPTFHGIPRCHGVMLFGLVSKVKNVLVSTMTSFAGTPASNVTHSSGVDESWEPRAEEIRTCPFLVHHRKPVRE